MDTVISINDHDTNQMQYALMGSGTKMIYIYIYKSQAFIQTRQNNANAIFLESSGVTVMIIFKHQHLLCPSKPREVSIYDYYLVLIITLQVPQ